MNDTESRMLAYQALKNLPGSQSYYRLASHLRLEEINRLVSACKTIDPGSTDLSKNDKELIQKIQNLDDGLRQKLLLIAYCDAIETGEASKKARWERDYQVDLDLTKIIPDYRSNQVKKNIHNLSTEPNKKLSPFLAGEDAAGWVYHRLIKTGMLVSVDEAEEIARKLKATRVKIQSLNKELRIFFEHAYNTQTVNLGNEQPFALLQKKPVLQRALQATIYSEKILQLFDRKDPLKNISIADLTQFQQLITEIRDEHKKRYSGILGKIRQFFDYFSGKNLNNILDRFLENSTYFPKKLSRSYPYRLYEATIDDRNRLKEISAQPPKFSLFTDKAKIVADTELHRERAKWSFKHELMRDAALQSFPLETLKTRINTSKLFSQNEKIALAKLEKAIYRAQGGICFKGVEGMSDEQRAWLTALRSNRFTIKSKINYTATGEQVSPSNLRAQAKFREIIKKM